MDVAGVRRGRRGRPPLASTTLARRRVRHRGGLRASSTLHALGRRGRPRGRRPRLGRPRPTLDARPSPTAATVERHPADKDATDLELALRAAQRPGATRVTVVGAGGGRLDHFLANALAARRARLGRLRARTRCVGDAARRRRAHVGRADAAALGSLVSLLAPVGDRPAASAPRGLRWPLADAELRPGSTRGVSNEMTAPTATVTRRATACCSRSSPMPSTDPEAQLESASDVRTRRHRPRRRARVRARRRACSVAAATTRPGRPADTVTLVTHDSFAASKPVLRAFTKQTGIKVKVLKNGDAGAALNQVILTKDAPARRRVLRRRQHVPDPGARRPGSSSRTRPQGLDTRPGGAAARPDRHRVTPVDFGDVCVNYDKAVVRRAKGSRPRRRSTTSRSPRTRTGSWSRTRRRRSPGPRVRARDGREVRRRRLARATGTAARPTASRSSTAGSRRTTASSRRGSGKGDVPARRELRVEPAGRGVLRRPEADDRARPASLTDTCFRQVEFAGVLHGAAHPRPRAQARRLHAVASGSRPTCRSRCSCTRPVTGTPLPAVFTKYADGAPDAAHAHRPPRSAPHRDDVDRRSGPTTVLR